MLPGVDRLILINYSLLISRLSKYGMANGLICCIQVKKKKIENTTYSTLVSSVSRRPSGAEIIMAVMLCLLTINRGSSRTRLPSGEKYASTWLPSVVLHTNSKTRQGGMSIIGGSTITGALGRPTRRCVIQL